MKGRELPGAEIFKWLLLMALAAPVSADIFTYDFTVTMINGPLVGQDFEGSFSYDDANISDAHSHWTTAVAAGNGAPPLESFSFTWEGTTYAAEDMEAFLQLRGDGSLRLGWGPNWLKAPNDSPTEAWSLHFGMGNIFDGHDSPAELDGAWAFFRDAKDGGGAWLGTVTMEQQ